MNEFRLPIQGGDPGLLNGGRKSVQSREICCRGRFPARPCMVGGCASHSIIPGHHPIQRFPGLMSSGFRSIGSRSGK